MNNIDKDYDYNPKLNLLITVILYCFVFFASVALSIYIMRKIPGLTPLGQPCPAVDSMPNRRKNFIEMVGKKTVPLLRAASGMSIGLICRVMPFGLGQKIQNLVNSAIQNDHLMGVREGHSSISDSAGYVPELPSVHNMEEIYSTLRMLGSEEQKRQLPESEAFRMMNVLVFIIFLTILFFSMNLISMGVRIFSSLFFTFNNNLINTSAQLKQGVSKIPEIRKQQKILEQQTIDQDHFLQKRSSSFNNKSNDEWL